MCSTGRVERDKPHLLSTTASQRRRALQATRRSAGELDISPPMSVVEASFHAVLVTNMHTFHLLTILFSISFEIGISVSMTIIANTTSSANGAVCVDSQRWVLPELIPNHCIAASIKFFDEAIEHQYRPYEFLAPGATPQTGVAIQTTPRRYTHCKPCCMFWLCLDIMWEERDKMIVRDQKTPWLLQVCCSIRTEGLPRPFFLISRRLAQSRIILISLSAYLHGSRC